MLVCLSDGEYGYAMMIAEKMHDESRSRGHRDQHGFRGDGSKIHRLGAAGELAVAKALGLPMKLGVNTFKAADLGASIQVRATFKPCGDLVIRPADAKIVGHVFVLANAVSGDDGLQEFQSFQIRGWCYGHEASVLGRWEERSDRPGAWFIKADQLRPLDTLPKEAVA